jgi:hypothetical protein
VPYLSFDLDALSQVPDVARAAGIPEGDVAHGLLRMWAHCFKRKTDEVDTTHLFGFFGGDCERVATVLVTFDFLDGAGPYRVKGAKRYLRISRVRSANAAKTNKKRWGSDNDVSQDHRNSDTFATLDVALTPNTEHLSSSKEELEEVGADSIRAMGALNVPAVEAGAVVDRRSSERPWAGKESPEPMSIGITIEAPATPPEEWLWRDFWRWAQSIRAQARLVAERPPNERAAGAWWALCLSTEGVSARALQRGFLKFGQSDHWEKADPPFPFRAFMSEWSKYTRLEVPDEAVA